MLARAIILDPDVLVADEPVSMLDMSVRAKILELMLALKREFDLTYVYITHDLATAKFFCDRIAIMYLGRIVEIGPAGEIYANPKHPYTVALLKAIPEPDPRRSVPRDLPRGRGSRRGDAAARLLVPPPLPACVRGLRLGEPRPADPARGALDPPAGVEFEAERALIGDLEALDEPALEAFLPAASGHRGDEVKRVLDALRAEAPDDPFWKGVTAIEVEPGGVRVRFHAGIVPREVEDGHARVRCHLYDPEALAAAGTPAKS